MTTPLTKAEISRRHSPDRRNFLQGADRLRSNLALVPPHGSVARSRAAETGKTSDEFLRKVVSACATNVAVLDESGKLLYASEAWRSLEQAVGSIAPESEPAAARARLVDSCADCASGRFSDIATLRAEILKFVSGTEKEFEGKYSFHISDRRWHFMARAARLPLPGGRFRILITYEDLVSVQEVGKSEERLSQLLDKTKIFAWEADATSPRFTYVSQQAEKILGYPAAHWYTRDFFTASIHPSDRKRALSLWDKASQHEDSFDTTFRLRARDGQIVWVQNVGSVSTENGKSRMHGFMVDITERKRAQEAMRSLGARLIAAQEEERSRVARELHDDLNQRMALLSIELEQLSPEIEKPRSLRRRVAKLQEQVREISADIHRLSYQLHPSKLDQLGLVAALKSLCVELSESGKLEVDFSQRGWMVVFPKDITLCLFRVAQEALRNCVKHSGASSAQVVLEKTVEGVRLCVTDNGCGFDTRSGLMEKGLGFISMKERLRLVRGDFHVYSHPARGTRIEANVRLHRAHQ